MSETTVNETVDPFAPSESRPSVSFKDKAIGTVYTLEVISLPKLLQGRDFETNEPAVWPNGDPQMCAVTNVIDRETGEELALWAVKPSALFVAIQAAQTAAEERIAVGGLLVVTYVSDKPNPDKPNLAPAKQFTVSYAPPTVAV